MQPSLNTIMSRLRLRQLRLLIALDECRSIHAAARQVAITQPGATRALNEIEETLGTTLFTRSSRGLLPSEAGRCAVRYARLIESDLSHLCDELAGIEQGLGGRLAVGGVMGAIPQLMENVARLRERYPALALEIVEDTSEGLMRRIDRGRLDMALCRADFGQHPGSYVQRGAFEERLQVVANVAHPLAGIPDLDFAPLARSQWIVYPVSMPRILEQEFIERGYGPGVRSVEISSTFAIISMLKRDRNILALLPERIAAEKAASRELVRLDYCLHVNNRPFELVWRRDRELPPAARYFLSLYDAESGDPPPGPDSGEARQA